MPVERTPPADRDHPREGRHEADDPLTEVDEKSRKAELRSLRRQRTMRRNAMRNDLVLIRELDPENPVFPAECAPDVMTRRIVQHATAIHNFNEKICSLISDENEWELEAPGSEELAREAVAAVASVEVAARSVQDRRTAAVVPPRTNPETAPRTPEGEFSEPSGQSQSSGTPANERDGDLASIATPAIIQPTCSFEGSASISRLTREYDMTPRVFSGDRLQYRTFVAEFEEYIGRRTDVSGLRKLLILKKFLRGEPLIIVEALELNDSNYKVAFSLLEKNYSRVDSEKTKVIGELRNLPSVAKPYDYAAISRLVTTVQSHISVLGVNGVALPEIALTLLDSMETSLPPRLRQDFFDHQQAERKFQRRATADTQSGGEIAAAQQQRALPAGAVAALEVENLIAFLRQRLRDMERLNGAPSSAEKKKQEKKGSYDNRKQQHSTVAAVSKHADNSKSSGSSKPAFRTKQCLFCRSHSHSSSKCDGALTVEQRRDILRRLDRCETCFRPKHANQAECEGPRSQCSKCKSKGHYSSMHSEESPAVKGTLQAVVGEPKIRPYETLLWTACAYLVNEGKRVPFRIFVDSGSSLTLATPALCRQILAPPISECDLSIQAFATRHARQAVPIRELRLVGPRGGSEVLIEACEHELEVDPSNIVPSQVAKAIRNFDKRSPIADRSYLGEWKPETPALLLGADQAHKLMLDQEPEIIVGQIRGYPSRFGFIIGGPVTPRPQAVTAVVDSNQLVCCAATVAHRSKLSSTPADAVQNLWSLEAIGVTNETASSPMSADEELAMQQLQASMTFTENRYTVSVPKRASIASLLNNYGPAVERLERKLSQLEKNPVRYQKYHGELMKFVERGYAEEVPRNDLPVSTSNDGTYYMPHHEVVTVSNSVEKWRVVFDCSARAKGATSLNDHLLSGPNLNPDLVTLLLNFRLHRVAVSADVTQAYMQIAVHKEDQRYFRFLWRYPGEEDIRAFQMQRVTWGAAPSGFILAAVLREQFRQNNPDGDRNFDSQFYADDYLASYPDCDKAIAATSELRDMLGEAGMTLAKWRSSSTRVMKHLTSTGVKNELIDAGNGGIFKVLGLSWAADEDEFLFATPDLSGRLAKDQTNTKREALSMVASLYDPLGWLAPFGLRGKRLLQQIWSAKLGWSDRISANCQCELRLWVHEMETFNKFRIPRQFVPAKGSTAAHRLHIFGDASPIGYAAVAYLENRYEGSPPAFSLVMCRSRVAPSEGTSLPRLELLAALIAVRLKCFLTERMNIEFEHVRFYTDSMITYYWVTSTNPGSFKTFVYNRVREIQTHSTPTDWFHLPGDCNVADLATRGVSSGDLIAADAWWNAPAWLGLPEGQKPTSQPRSIAAENLPSDHLELRKTVASVSTMPTIVNIETFRSVGHAIRVLAHVLRFIAIKCRRQTDNSPRELYRRAELLLIRWTQSEHFREEVSLTKSGERVPATSKIAAFHLFIDDDGLLRAETRLTGSRMLSYDEKNPIVLPGESHLAKLYIIETHRINAHFGVTTILSLLRRRFWVTRGRQVIKALLARCVICRKKQGRHATQIEAPLPAYRVELQAPFATTGVDFAGPFYTKYRQDTAKTYIALFTCAATRAVHLEAVPSMTAPQTGLALRRFLASYPSCQRFVSDNGRSFVRAASDLKKLFNSVRDREVADILQGRLIDWEFNCPRAPWHGGFFERLVGVVKSALYKTLGKSLIGFEQFRTILVELSCVINSRPLSYTSDDSDCPAPITPAHFLKGGPPVLPLAGLVSVDRLSSDECLTTSELRAGVKHRTTYFQSLVGRWFREYLLLLRNANCTTGRVQKPIPHGEVCLLRDDNVPRIRWQLVRVIEQHTGRDGRIRGYTIKLPSGKTTRRAAQVLYPLEVGPERETDGENPEDQTDL